MSAAEIAAQRLPEPAPRALTSAQDRGGPTGSTTDAPPPWTPSTGSADEDASLSDGFYRSAESTPMPPVEPEWVDGEEVYTVYRPTEEDAHDAA